MVNPNVTKLLLPLRFKFLLSWWSLVVKNCNFYFENYFKTSLCLKHYDPFKITLP